MTMSAEQEQLRRAVGGDAMALDALWRAHRRWVAAVLLAHATPAAELEDVLQDVAMSLVRNLGKLEHPGAFRAWLRTVALNTARSAARRRDLRRRVERVPDGRPEGLVDPASGRPELAESVADTLDQVARLPSELREPLMLRAVDGLSQREIAAVLGVPETTVETRLARARRLLRSAADEGSGADAVCNGWNRRRAT